MLNVWQHVDFRKKNLIVFFSSEVSHLHFTASETKNNAKNETKKVLHFSSSIKFNSENILPNILANGGCTCVFELDLCRQLCFGYTELVTAWLVRGVYVPSGVIHLDKVKLKTEFSRHLRVQVERKTQVIINYDSVLVCACTIFMTT